MARKPVVAGQFYEGSMDKLDKQIRECYLGEKGPGEIPILKRTKKIKAIIAPHAGYQFSGQCAAWAYKELAETPMPDIYILLGVSHKGHDTCISTDNWETPYGVVRIDQEFASALVKKGNIKVDNQAHLDEHSIEVQLPMLQFANRNEFEKIKIIPIMVGEQDEYKTLALDIKETLLDMEKTAIFITSSDFTHYGRNYHYLPFTMKIPENIQKLDNDAIDLIKKLNSIEFLKYVDTTGATICGKNGIALLIELFAHAKVQLLSYYMSGDFEADYKNTVSYVAISFE